MISHYIITAQVQRHAFKITVSVKFEYVFANSIKCVITFYILGFLLFLFIVEYILFIDQLLVLLQCRLQLNLRIKFLLQKRQYPNYILYVDASRAALRMLVQCVRDAATHGIFIVTACDKSRSIAKYIQR